MVVLRLMAGVWLVCSVSLAVTTAKGARSRDDKHDSPKGSRPSGQWLGGKLDVGWCRAEVKAGEDIIPPVLYNCQLQGTKFARIVCQGNQTVSFPNSLQSSSFTMKNSTTGEGVLRGNASGNETLSLPCTLEGTSGDEAMGN